MEEDKLDKIIDSLSNCFDGNGEFAFHPLDENRALIVFNSAISDFGMGTNDFINLLIGQAKTMYVDSEVIARAEQSIKEFVYRQHLE